VRQVGVGIRDLVDIKIPRVREMRAQELGVPVLVLIRQVFGGIEHHQIRLAEFAREPVGCHQRSHASSSNPVLRWTASIDAVLAFV